MKWNEYELSDLVQIFDGPHATPRKTETGPYFLSISSLKNGRLDLSESAHLSEHDFAKWTRRVTPEPGDLLFSYETRLGQAALMIQDIRACLGRRMGILRPDQSKINPKFLLLAYLAPEFQETIRSRSVHGATVDRIPLKEMSRWPIRIPSIGEQQAICEVLGALDDKIAVNDRIAATARELGTSMFRQSIQNDRVKVLLESIVDHISRGVAPKYTDDFSGMPVLNQKCIRNGVITLENARKTLAEKVKEVKQLRRNDVLINSTGVGTLGRVARWTGSGTATVDSHVTIVRFAGDKVDPVCAGFALLLAEPQIEMLGEGSTGQTELKRAQLAGFEVALPTADRQAELRKKLESLENRIDQARAESNALAELRDTLLPRLMSGEIRVKDAERTVEDVT